MNAENHEIPTLDAKYTIVQKIDLNTWKRREHFEFFYRNDYPQYNLCANVDVTRYLDYCRKNGLSFYYAMIFASTQVANSIENFRYRIREDKQIVLHDTLHPGFTDMIKGDACQLFKMVVVEMEVGLHEFVAKAKRISDAQTNYFGNPVETRDDLLYITCIPWVSFTSMSHTLRLGSDDAVPRISWGKYFKQADVVLLPFSVQAHHSFVDGIHIGQYFEQLQSFLNSF